MSIDVVDLRAFYGSPLGQLAHRLVGRAAEGFWRDAARLRVLGLGYATPFMPGPGAASERSLAFMPASQGVVNWPSPALSASALVDPLTMPLAEASVDRVLAVHVLEVVESPAELMGEIWRVLTPGGRLLLVCPNRRGLWSRLDRTPFGHGQPFSRSQVRRLLRQAHFAPEGWAEILYVPPFRSRFLLSGAPAWESLGRALSLPFAGLHVVEASKQFQSPIPIREKRRARRPAPVLRPVPATSRDAAS